MNVSARVTIDTEFFCWCFAIQPQDFSCCRIWMTLDTVYNCWCYVFICWNGSKVEGLLLGVFLLISPNCICGEECSFLSWPIACSLWWCKSVLEYSIFLQGSTAQIFIAECTAPFISPYTLQLLVQHAYQHPQPCIQLPSQLWVFHMMHTQHVCTPLTMVGPSGSRIQLRDHTDLSDLLLIPLFVVFFNRILNLSKLQNSFLFILLK